MKEFARQFYNSRAWRDCRRAHIARRRGLDGGLCQVCGVEPGWIVHHRTPLTPENITDPAITLGADNLSYECKACHDRHEGHGVDRRRPMACAFGPDGHPVDLREG